MHTGTSPLSARPLRPAVLSTWVHAIPLLTSITVTAVRPAAEKMLASKTCTQAQLLRHRNSGTRHGRALIVCQLQIPKVSKPRQVLTGLAALVLSVQSYAAQASPMKPGLQVGLPQQQKLACPLLAASSAYSLLQSILVKQYCVLQQDFQLDSMESCDHHRCDLRPIPQAPGKLLLAKYARKE